MRKITFTFKRNLRYVWDTPEIFQGFARDLVMIYPRFAWDWPKICPWVAQYVPGICPRFARDLPEICSRFAHDLLEICLRFPRELLKICPTFPEICLRFFQDLSNTHSRFSLNKFFDPSTPSLLVGDHPWLVTILEWYHQVLLDTIRYHRLPVGTIWYYWVRFW